jgi:hypothetical protein
VCTIDTSGISNTNELNRHLERDVGTSNLDAFAEELEDLQDGPEEHVTFLWIGADDALRVARHRYSELIDLFSATAVDLADRTAWGAPPDNFPESDLIAVRLELLLVPTLLSEVAAAVLADHKSSE